jgi:hypothetical protein
LLAVAQELVDGAPWTTGHVIFFGKPILQPRKYCYMADTPNLGYKYAGAEMKVQPWHPAVLPLKVPPALSCFVPYQYPSLAND